MKHRLALDDGRMVELDDSQLQGLATGKAAKAAPQSFEKRILWRVCENVTSMSATSIAAEEWTGWSDPCNVVTVTWALESLNEQGLVTYLMAGSPGFTEQPARIRATKAGYEAAGYPPPMTILIGAHRSYRHDISLRPGDPTEFRNFLDIAVGGPIERDSLKHHLEKYPEHVAIHPSTEELHMSREDAYLAAIDTSRTPDLVEQTVDQIMAERGVAWRTAYTMRKQATAELASEGASESLSHKILEILKNGDVRDVEELRSALFFAHEDMSASNIDITKAVWSLQKRALVTFYERKHGRDSLITKIKLTKRGMTEMGVLPERHSLKPDKVKPSRELKHPSPIGKDMTDARNQPAKTTGGPVERVYVAPRPNGDPDWKTSGRPATEETLEAHSKRYAAPEPPRQNEKPAPVKTFVDDFPLIADLMGKEERLKGYEAAAKALEGVDEEMALALLDKIQLTELEKEVIRYVRTFGSSRPA